VYRPQREFHTLNRVWCPSDGRGGYERFVHCKLHGVVVIARKIEQKEERKIVILLLKHNI
jgi:hypothetical protein